MKKLLKTIAKALLAMPVLAWTICAATGRMVLSAILPPQPQAMTTEAGAAADEAVEVAQAREERKAAAPGDQISLQSRIALTYAAAIVTGSRVPDVSGQPHEFRRWLADLTPAGAARLFKMTMPTIERHLNPKRPEDHIAGVPSIGIRPDAAAPVGDGSKMYLEALASVAKPEMCADGEFRIYHGHPGEDQSMRLKAA